MKKKILFFAYSLVTVSLFTGCMRPMVGPDVYTVRGVGETSRTYVGVVEHLRSVLIAPDDYVGDRTGSVLAGGALGGLTGSCFGGGSGRIATTLGGIAAGALLGDVVNRSASEMQWGTEYVVRLSDSSRVTIVQGQSPALAVGQTVYVIEGGRGRSRVVAA